MENGKTNQNKQISAFSIAFILIGALFGAAFASGQEMMKFFCAYGDLGKVGFVLCFILYSLFGYMAYDLSRIRNSEKMEDVVAPTSNPIIMKLTSLVMLFCFLIILIALIAAGDALFSQQLNFPKGVGGIIITLLVVATNIAGFDGIKKVMPKVIPVMLITIFAICLGIVFMIDSKPYASPEKFMSPLAPNWAVGAVLYLAYNFLVTIPVLCTLPKTKKTRKNVYLGMVMGFATICIFGFIIYSAIFTDISTAGEYELPMVYLAARISPAIGVIYSLIMVIAIYAASSNCLFGLTKDIDRSNNRKRILYIAAIAVFAYAVSLVGFTQIVNYAIPIEGYACIIMLILMLVTYVKYKSKELTCQFDGNDLEKPQKNDIL